MGSLPTEERTSNLKVCVFERNENQETKVAKKNPRPHHFSEIIYHSKENDRS